VSAVACSAGPFSLQVPDHPGLPSRTHPASGCCVICRPPDCIDHQREKQRGPSFLSKNARMPVHLRCRCTRQFGKVLGPEASPGSVRVYRQGPLCQAGSHFWHSGRWFKPPISVCWFATVRKALARFARKHRPTCQGEAGERDAEMDTRDYRSGQAASANPGQRARRPMP
jgi:hypothetical protein